MEEKSDSNYGTITVGFGTYAIRDVPIKSYVQARFLDNRLVTIMAVEDKGEHSYVISIENPESTGRSTQKIWLSEESLIAFQTLTIIMVGAEGKDLKEALSKSLEQSDTSHIRYSCSNNLKTFNNNPSPAPPDEKMG